MPHLSFQSGSRMSAYGIVFVCLAGISLALTDAPASQQAPELMPQEKEMAMALSAGPDHIRANASVYVLQKNGFVLARQGTNGFACIVNRDHPLNQKPTCYDPEGAATILPKVLRVGELLMKGVPLD